MLVLTRKNTESVVVGSPDDVECSITITVLEIRGRRVMLGFEAADSVNVLRGELWEQQHAGGQPPRPKVCGEAATPEQQERWDDDGGGADRPTECPATR